MIHSARPIVTPVANIVFCCFVFLDLKNGNWRTDGQHVGKQLGGRVDQFLVEFEPSIVALEIHLKLKEDFTSIRL